MTLLLTLAALLLVACGENDSETTTETSTVETPTEGTTGDGASAGSGANAPAPSGDAVRAAKVEIVDFAYDPDPVTIEAGGKVTWQNEDSVEHTATLDDGSFDTGALAEGKLKSQSFKTPGTFAYHCEIHPEMEGTVEVVEG